MTPAVALFEMSLSRKGHFSRPFYSPVDQVQVTKTDIEKSVKTVVSTELEQHPQGKDRIINSHNQSNKDRGQRTEIYKGSRCSM